LNLLFLIFGVRASFNTPRRALFLGPGCKMKKAPLNRDAFPFFESAG